MIVARRLLLVALAAVLLSLLPQGQAVGNATLVKNINPVERFSFPIPETGVLTGSTIAAVGERLFYVYSDRLDGAELWVTGGDSGGPRLVRDIQPGPPSSDIRGLVALGNVALFSARHGASTALWRSDGTIAGTRTVHEDVVSPGELTVVGDRAYVVSNPGIGSRSIWGSDGTAAGTIKLREASGIGDALLGTAGSTIYWVETQSNPTEYILWKSDGTIAGTQQVGSVGAPLAGERAAALGATIYFLAESGGGRALWKSDGTAAGTAAVRSFEDPRELVSTGAMLFFANNAGGSAALWRSDGTSGGSQIVQSYILLNLINDLRVVDHRVMFADPNGQISLTDGSTVTPMTGATYESFGGLHVAKLNGAIYFSALYAGGGHLWRTDGTSAGTGVIWPSTGSYPVKQLASAGASLYLLLENGFGTYLAQSDGSTAGTVSVESRARYEYGINTSAADLPGARPALLGGELYFPADDGTHGAELWRSDGTSAGTKIVANLQANDLLTPSGSQPANLTLFQDALYFTANDGRGIALWRTDGTEAGTVLVKILDTATAAGPLAASNGMLFFLTRESGPFGLTSQFWRSDGTPAGTQVFSNMLQVSSFVVSDGRLFLSARQGAAGNQLWVSDGTPANTVALTDLNAAGGGLQAQELTGDGAGSIFFLASPGGNQELWVSDGTAAGTQMLKVFTYAISTPASRLVTVGGRVFFAATEFATGEELWVSDGTAVGTVMVRDIATSNAGTPLAASASPRHLTRLGERLLFSANDEAHGRELWVSDGTEQGTAMVVDLLPGVAGGLSATPTNVAENRWSVIDGVAYFAGSDGSSGVELWSTDGSAAGTQLVADIAAGPGSSNPIGAQSFGDRIAMLADDGATGLELWLVGDGGPALGNYRAALPLVAAP